MEEQAGCGAARNIDLNPIDQIISRKEATICCTKDAIRLIAETPGLRVGRDRSNSLYTITRKPTTFLC